MIIKNPDIVFYAYETGKILSNQNGTNKFSFEVFKKAAGEATNKLEGIKVPVTVQELLLIMADLFLKSDSPVETNHKAPKVNLMSIDTKGFTSFSKTHSDIISAAECAYATLQAKKVWKRCNEEFGDIDIPDEYDMMINTKGNIAIVDGDSVFVRMISSKGLVSQARFTIKLDDEFKHNITDGNSSKKGK